jgi:hypothetical protein
MSTPRRWTLRWTQPAPLAGPPAAVRLAGLALLAAALACNRPLEEPPASQTGTPAPAPASATEPAAEPAGSLDLSHRPQIWFGPLDPAPPDSNRPYSGALDYFDLFQPEAPWRQAASGIHVFKLYGGWLDRAATIPELEAIVADLQRRGLGIAFEGGPLTPTAQCTGVIEGFAGPVEGGNAARKLQQAGGTLHYVDLEHPYDAVKFSGAPVACSYAPERAAQDVRRYVEAIRAIFPGAQFGAVETANHDVQEVATWVEAYRAVLGEDLAYFSFDLNYHRPNWAAEARAIEDYLRSRGIEFGLFYRGDEDAGSDAEWVATAEARFVEYEVVAGGQPDRVILQSWHPHPERLLPETDPTTFTALINRYLRQRTVLALDAQPSAAGGLELAGSLQEASGAQLPGASVELSLTPLDGAGLVSDYTLVGTVPSGAVQADVGYRVNTECDCSGPSEFTLYEVRYSEGVDGPNRVPNPRFANGLEGWGVWGSGSANLVASDQGSGRALHVRAGPDQDAAINSGRFAVQAGAEFRLTFVARVAPRSPGSGYFDVIFLGPSREVRRFQIPLQAATLALGQTAADGAGHFVLVLDQAPDQPTALRAWYPGDGQRWPSYAEIVVGSG